VLCPLPWAARSMPTALWCRPSPSPPAARPLTAPCCSLGPCRCHTEQSSALPLRSLWGAASFSSVYHLRKLSMLTKVLQYFVFPKWKPGFQRSWQLECTSGRGPMKTSLHPPRRILELLSKFVTANPYELHCSKWSFPNWWHWCSPK